MKRQSPIGWYGAKAAMSHHLLEILPDHRVYVEAFAGSAALFFAKQPATIEVLNDLNGDLVNFYRVLRQPETARRLRHLLELTPYARSEYDQCETDHASVSEPVEKARQFYVLVEQSINGNFRNRWSRDKTGNRPKTFHRQLDLIEKAVARLQNVQIECKDFENVLKAFDTPYTLSYLDPPYPAKTRTAPKMYACEMTDADHLRLLRWAKQAQGMVVLSGYRNTLYDSELKGWFTIDIPGWCFAGVKKRKNGRPQSVSKRVEVLWLNAAAVTDKARALKARLEAAG